ncbi:MAG: DUF3999 domain-containing protein [Verrucomicrobiales bacterium]|jgi:hypothetical protein|nr:DUF3999 domain-containing protein [Verrucomicrobiales bacterium]
MKTKLSILLIALSVSARAVEPSLFRHEAPLTGVAVDGGSPVRVPLSVSVLRATQPGQPDLRLYDDTDKETPYVLHYDIKPGEARVLDSAPLTFSHVADTYYTWQPDDLPLVKVELDIATPYFYRRVLLSARDQNGGGEHPVTEGAIHRLPNKSKPKTTLDLDGQRHRRPVLWIFNGDNAPLTISGATGYYIRRNLYFIPEAGKSYRLCFGSDSARAPRYDLQDILPADSEQLAAAPAWQLGEATASHRKNFFAGAANGGLPARALQILVLLMVSGLGFWAWRLFGKLK